jgi:hypothetical protein
MLPLSLGRILEEERQRQIESTLERRRLLAPVEPPATLPGPAERTSTVRRRPTVARAQAPGGDPVCPTS